MKTVVVTGATSLIGHFLLPRLKAAGYRVIALSRNPDLVNDRDWSAESGIESVLQADISKPQMLELPHTDILIHLAPLWLLPALINAKPELANARIIAFSSTSRLSKAESPSAAEREVSDKLADAEEQILANNGLRATIFRPTLIYGAGLDKNVSMISSWISRFRFFPIVGGGSGLRQPVHADDLARACLQVIDQPVAERKIYDLVGGEQLTYLIMVKRIFTALQYSPRIVSLPFGIVGSLIRIISRLPKYKSLTPEMALRMNKDLVFDSSEAKQDFNYQARGFNPVISDLRGKP